MTVETMKEYKKKNDFSYAIGVYPTLELLKYRIETVSRVLIHSKGIKSDGVRKIKEICLKNRIKIEIASGEIDKISQSQNCYAIGVFDKYQSPIVEGNHLVLVSPEDTGNLGTIIRTMVAFEIDNLALIRPAIDVFDPKTIRASMGAIFQINYAYFDRFDEYTKQFDNNKLHMFISKGGTTINSVVYTEPYSLVFGSESAGLPVSITKQGYPVRIPCSYKIDSLNLAIAAGIGLQKTFK